jgi:hypothetical protein
MKSTQYILHSTYYTVHREEYTQCNTCHRLTPQHTSLPRCLGNRSWFLPCAFLRASFPCNFLVPHCTTMSPVCRESRERSREVERGREKSREVERSREKSREVERSREKSREVEVQTLCQVPFTHYCMKFLPCPTPREGTCSFRPSPPNKFLSNKFLPAPHYCRPFVCQASPME